MATPVSAIRALSAATTGAVSSRLPAPEHTADAVEAALAAEDPSDDSNAAVASPLTSQRLVADATPRRAIRALLAGGGSHTAQPAASSATSAVPTGHVPVHADPEPAEPWSPAEVTSRAAIDDTPDASAARTASGDAPEAATPRVATPDAAPPAAATPDRDALPGGRSSPAAPPAASSLAEATPETAACHRAAAAAAAAATPDMRYASPGFQSDLRALHACWQLATPLPPLGTPVPVGTPEVASLAATPLASPHAEHVGSSGRAGEKAAVATEDSVATDVKSAMPKVVMMASPVALPKASPTASAPVASPVAAPVAAPVASPAASGRASVHGAEQAGSNDQTAAGTASPAASPVASPARSAGSSNADAGAMSPAANSPLASEAGSARGADATTVVSASLSASPAKQRPGAAADIADDVVRVCVPVLSALVQQPLPALPVVSMGAASASLEAEAQPLQPAQQAAAVVHAPLPAEARPSSPPGSPLPAQPQTAASPQRKQPAAAPPSEIEAASPRPLKLQTVAPPPLLDMDALDSPLPRAARSTRRKLPVDGPVQGASPWHRRATAVLSITLRLLLVAALSFFVLSR